MTIAAMLNLIAWLLSALIAAWLIFDMVRVTRSHSEDELLNIPETFDALAGPPPGPKEELR